MTDEEIDKLESGIATDAAIAEAFYGWIAEAWTDTFDGQQYSHKFQSPDGVFRWANPEPFSTEISATMQLVEDKLRAQWCVTLRTVEDESANKWRCSLAPLHSTRHEVASARGWAEAAPLAICKAALKGARA